MTDKPMPRNLHVRHLRFNSNSSGLIFSLPLRVVKAMNWNSGDLISFEQEGHKLIIKKVQIVDAPQGTPSISVGEKP